MFGQWNDKNATTVSIDELFDGVASVEEHVVEKRSAKKTVGAIFGIIGISVVAGLLVSMLPLAMLSSAAMVADPMVSVWKQMPSELGDIQIAQRNTLYDANGDVFAEVWSEDRIALKSLDEISDYAKKGLLATEDKRFYEHKGFDPKGTFRALLSSGGGSGITQQLVKNLQFYNMAGKEKKKEAVESTYTRKLKELKLAIEYEKTHSKDEILLAYFNTVAFGGPNIYSIESASNYFFGKSAKDLTLAESAVLVGSVQNPAAYNLDNDDRKNQWKTRQKTVLNRMVAEGYITQEEASNALAEELTLVRKKRSAGNCVSSKYPFYCNYVFQYLSRSPKLGETQDERDAILAKGGLHIKTYMNPQQMQLIDEQLEKDFGNGNRVVAPVAVVNPGNGGVSGIGVNRNYGVGEGETTLNVPANPAATGSTFKMVALAAALESGMDPADMQFSSQCPYSPSGYDHPRGGFHNSNGCTYQAGNINYKQATAWSSNTWFLTLATKIGMNKIFDMSRNLNLNVPKGVTERSLSFVLGSVENSPINMAAAYATFANEGVFCPATPVASYEYADGTSPAIPDTYDPSKDSCRRVMSPHTASTVLQAMRANTYPGEVEGAFGTKAQIQGYDAVGKSGTNQNYNYAWAQVSKTHSIYMGIYDMDTVTRGVDGMVYRGQRQSINPASQAASDVLRAIVAGSGESNQPLDYDNADRSLQPVPVEKRDFFTIPSVVGMQPAEAVSTMESLGIVVHVSKETKPAPEGYPSGVVVEQSLTPGLQLPVGTKKEIVLYTSS